MNRVMFNPSQVSASELRHCTGLPNKQSQTVAAALLAYLVAHGDKWSHIVWTEFAAYLRGLPEGSDVPGANEAKSIFSWELMSGVKELIRLKLVNYHEDDDWKEHIELSLDLMKIYVQAHALTQHKQAHEPATAEV